MIVKNEFVKIKQGSKNITMKNLLLDEYLKLFSVTQYQGDRGKNSDKALNNCFIKLDSSIGLISPTSSFDDSDFDLMLTMQTNDAVFNRNSCEASYEYGTRVGGKVYLSSFTGESEVNLADYSGRKITALGFGKDSIYSVIDTSSYDFYIDDSGLLSVFRKDIISSDAVCDSNPYHLSPFSIKRVNIPYDEGTYLSYAVFAKLYSIGLGFVEGKMEQEFIIGEDIDIDVEDDFTFGFVLKKGNTENLFPSPSIQPSSSKYPVMVYIKNFLFPNQSMQPSSSKYPVQHDLRTVIYKYRLYYINRGDAVTYLDEYYTMSFICDAKGLFEIKTKIRRGDD